MISFFLFSLMACETEKDEFMSGLSSEGSTQPNPESQCRAFLRAYCDNCEDQVDEGAEYGDSGEIHSNAELCFDFYTDMYDCANTVAVSSSYDECLTDLPGSACYMIPSSCYEVLVMGGI